MRFIFYDYFYIVSETSISYMFNEKEERTAGSREELGG